MMKVRKQGLITRMMEAMRLTPLQGYRALKKNFASMTDCEKTTDGCIATIDLEEHDATTFMSRMCKR